VHPGDRIISVDGEKAVDIMSRLHTPHPETQFGSWHGFGPACAARLQLNGRILTDVIKPAPSHVFDLERFQVRLK